MAKILARPNVTISVTVELSEAEIGALDALAGYGVDEFLKVFYERMGRSYLEPHEKGLRSLFGSVRESWPNMMSMAKEARKAVHLE